MAKAVSIVTFLFQLSALYAQAQIDASSLKSKEVESISVQFDNHLFGHPFLFKKGTSISSFHSVWKRKNHNMSVSPRIGWISLPNVENKFFITPTINYQFLTKRFYSNIGIGVIYTASVLNYDRYEYINGVFTKQSSVLHNLGTSAHLNLGYNLYFIKKISISPYLGFASTQFYKGYTSKFLEGHKPSISFGVNISKTSKQ
jgi:hypothetical protein